ncbi:hypothetical protein QNH48_23450 [Neobacillus sp. YX16]|uniref:hypothetical protein n=1 Tax=Neobacillus sp. YX16 TaxID=3047874 RepID=UPI0024C441EA|nr:hypothetical protein [Neobacillus sp. YX16]WHZ01906.1 hypothetical protein QNH48_23450 [Neobacillus sp. YX16]
MELIIWAFSSMVLLLLIISVLPLGFTKKGKLLVVFLGFLLALGGIAASATFPLWQTFLFILALTFFAAYILNNRLSGFFYHTPQLDEENDIEVSDIPFTTIPVEKDSEIDILDLQDFETRIFPSQNREERIKIITDLSFNSEIGNVSTNDEDIAFLQDRNISNDVEEEEIKTKIELDSGYLSEIESLLLEETVGILEPVHPEAKSENKVNDYFLNELYLPIKEVASGKEKIELEKVNS